MEASTGTILYAKGIDEQHYPASITKIMTVLLALENCQMDEEVTFSHNAVYSIDYGSSSIARDEGEVLTVEECLLCHYAGIRQRMRQRYCGTHFRFHRRIRKSHESAGCGTGMHQYPFR